MKLNYLAQNVWIVLKQNETTTVMLLYDLKKRIFFLFAQAMLFAKFEHWIFE